MRYDYELRPYYRELNRIPLLMQGEQQHLLAALSTAGTGPLAVQAEQTPIKHLIWSRKPTSPSSRPPIILSPPAGVTSPPTCAPGCMRGSRER
jgi:hypothetical protein